MTGPLRFIIPMVALCSALGCKPSPGRIETTGTKSGASRPLTGFANVEIGAALSADVAVGKEFLVTVTGDENLIPRVRTRVQGETLVIGLEDNTAAKGVRVMVRAPVLRGIEATGASDVTISGLTGDGMRIGAHGASHLRAKDTRGEHLAIDASGASTVDIAGAVTNLVIDVSGASHVRGRELAVQKAVLDVSGASTLQLQGKDVSGDASGASRVQVWGAPARLVVEASGAASVAKMP